MRDIKKRPPGGPAAGSGDFLVRHRFRDVDELARVARAWDLDFRQVARGPLEGDVIQWGSERVQLARARLRGRVHQVGSTPAGYRTFAIPAIRDIRLFWRGQVIGPDQVMVFPHSRELNCASHPDFDMITVSVTQDDLDDAAERARLPSLDRCLAGREVVSCDSERLSRTRRWLLRSLEAVSKLPPGVDRLRRPWASSPLLPDAQRHRTRARRVVDPKRTAQTLLQLVSSSSVAPSGNRTTAWQAAEMFRGRSRDLFLHRSLSLIDRAEPPLFSVGDLARAAGCSPRTLRRVFTMRFGVGPKRYLLARRLTGVRRELRGADPNATIIADVANRWGFWHLGQFAADYRLFFRELPSTTLGRGA